MNVLLDTHAWAWAVLKDTSRLSSNAVMAITESDAVFVSPISIFEIGQKVRRGKWPEMEPYVDKLQSILAERGGKFAPLTPDICLVASRMEWDHRDPFDRFIAATAIENELQLISTDRHFDTLSSRKEWIGRFW